MTVEAESYCQLMPNLIDTLQHENSSLRHRFRQETHPKRANVIMNVHDVENCGFCALLDIARVARVAVGEGPEIPAGTFEALADAVERAERWPERT